MPPSRRAVLALLTVGVAGCAGDRLATDTDSLSAAPPSGTEPDGTATEYEIPPVPEPSEAALDRWCEPASGVADSRLSVLGEALDADESVVIVGFTGDGELRNDGPEVVLSGVVDESHVGENAYLSEVAFADGTLTVSVDYGYPPETAETATPSPTQVGMAMGVRYSARVAMEAGFPETVRVRHHGDVVADVDGPC
jgi:hypothetical protein